jgi:hypothetical protein
VSASDVIAVVCGVTALAAVAVLALVTQRLLSVVAQLRTTVEHLTAHSVEVIGAAAEASERTAHEIERLDALIHTADAVSERADAALRVLANPVIKGAAVAAGTRGAARRLRGRDRETG